MFGLLLVVAAAFCHATWNFFLKQINGGPELVWLFSAISVVLYLPLAIVIFLRSGAALGYAQWIFIAGSAALHLGYFLLLQRGYRQGDLSLIYPTARATGPILSTALAVAFLGELLSLQMLGGGLLIVVGILYLTGGFKRGARYASASLLFGLAAGTFIGSYTVWDAHAVSALMVPPLLLDYGSNASRCLLLLPHAVRRKERVASHWREHRTGVICIAIFSPLAYILVLYALTFTPVIYVAPIREISVLIAVLMGTLLLREGHLRQRAVWAALILTGVAILATG